MADTCGAMSWRDVLNVKPGGVRVGIVLSGSQTQYSSLSLLPSRFNYSSLTWLNQLSFSPRCIRKQEAAVMLVNLTNKCTRHISPHNHKTCFLYKKNYKKRKRTEKSLFYFIFMVICHQILIFVIH